MPADGTRTLRSREVILLRLLGALLALLLVLGGPVGRQLLGLTDRHLSRWIMFRGIGLTLIDARFYSRSAQGELTRLDRYELLKRAPGEAKRDFRRLRSKKAVEQMGRRLCKALGEGADVRIVSRVATRSGWRPQLDGDSNVCERPVRPRPRQTVRAAKPEAGRAKAPSAYPARSSSADSMDAVKGEAEAIAAEETE